MEIMRNLLARVFLKNPFKAERDGPPDLDEIFKDLRNKVDNIFKPGARKVGGGGSSDQNSGNPSRQYARCSSR